MQNNYKHYAYRKAIFITGNVTSDYQLSQIISIKPEGELTSAQRITRCLDVIKHHLSNFQHSVIEENAKNGMHQTVYVVRNRNTKQGIIVLDHTGKVLHQWQHLDRPTTTELLNQVAGFLSEKQAKTHAERVAEGNEWALMN